MATRAVAAASIMVMETKIMLSSPVWGLVGSAGVLVPPVVPVVPVVASRYRELFFLLNMPPRSFALFPIQETYALLNTRVHASKMKQYAVQWHILLYT